MRGALLACLGILSTFTTGCTFVTNCPCADAGGTGGKGSAGTSAGGTTGATGGTGGTSGTSGSDPGEFGPSPAEDAEWTNATSNLAGLDSTCGNLSFMSNKPDEDMLIAGVTTQGLWSSRDGGASWEQLGATDDSDDVANTLSQIIYDPDDSDTWWEAGIYGPGIFKTTDNGVTIKEVGTVRHNDSLSIDFADPKRKTMIAGGHEQARTVYLSKDAGDTWENIGAAVPEDTRASSSPLLLDPETFLLGCAGPGTGVSGIFRSEDGGGSFERVSTGGGYRFPLVATDGYIYWSGDEVGQLFRSQDSGLTWEQTTNTGTVFQGTPLELPDGRIATLGARYILVSADRGDTWESVSPPLPFAPAGVVYSTFQRAFFIWHWTCGNPVPVPDDAILRFDFDWEASTASE